MNKENLRDEILNISLDTDNFSGGLNLLNIIKNTFNKDNDENTTEYTKYSLKEIIVKILEDNYKNEEIRDILINLENSEINHQKNCESEHNKGEIKHSILDCNNNNHYKVFKNFLISAKKRTSVNFFLIVNNNAKNLLTKLQNNDKILYEQLGFMNNMTGGKNYYNYNNYSRGGERAYEEGTDLFKNTYDDNIKLIENYNIKMVENLDDILSLFDILDTLAFQILNPEVEGDKVSKRKFIDIYVQPILNELYDKFPEHIDDMRKWLCNSNFFSPNFAIDPSAIRSGFFLKIPNGHKCQIKQEYETVDEDEKSPISTGSIKSESSRTKSGTIKLSNNPLVLNFIELETTNGVKNVSENVAMFLECIQVAKNNRVAPTPYEFIFGLIALQELGYTIIQPNEFKAIVDSTPNKLKLMKVFDGTNIYDEYITKNNAKALEETINYHFGLSGKKIYNNLKNYTKALENATIEFFTNSAFSNVQPVKLYNKRRNKDYDPFEWVFYETEYLKKIKEKKIKGGERVTIDFLKENGSIYLYLYCPNHADSIASKSGLLGGFENYGGYDEFYDNMLYNSHGGLDVNLYDNVSVVASSGTGTTSGSGRTTYTEAYTEGSRTGIQKVTKYTKYDFDKEKNGYYATDMVEIAKAKQWNRNAPPEETVKKAVGEPRFIPIEKVPPMPSLMEVEDAFIKLYPKLKKIVESYQSRATTEGMDLHPIQNGVVDPRVNLDTAYYVKRAINKDLELPFLNTMKYLSQIILNVDNYFVRYAIAKFALAVISKMNNLLKINNNYLISWVGYRSDHFNRLLDDDEIYSYIFYMDHPDSKNPYPNKEEDEDEYIQMVKAGELIGFESDINMGIKGGNEDLYDNMLYNSEGGLDVNLYDDVSVVASSGTGSSSGTGRSTRTEPYNEGSRTGLQKVTTYSDIEFDKEKNGYYIKDMQEIARAKQWNSNAPPEEVKKNQIGETRFLPIEQVPPMPSLMEVQDAFIKLYPKLKKIVASYQERTQTKGMDLYPDSIDTSYYLRRAFIKDLEVPYLNTIQYLTQFILNEKNYFARYAIAKFALAVISSMNALIRSNDYLIFEGYKTDHFNRLLDQDEIYSYIFYLDHPDIKDPYPGNKEEDENEYIERVKGGELIGFESNINMGIARGGYNDHYSQYGGSKLLKKIRKYKKQLKKIKKLRKIVKNNSN